MSFYFLQKLLLLQCYGKKRIFPYYEHEGRERQPRPQISQEDNHSDKTFALTPIEKS